MRILVVAWLAYGLLVEHRALAEPGVDFQIQVVDGKTGRGVPLVELRTVNNIRYFTDSSGIIAFHEPGLMDKDVFFFVESHGYEFPKDGFGFAGKTLHVKAGDSIVLKIRRINIAERLYRVTGQGIYRDSILCGRPAPINEPVINGLVLGQDSVATCIYRGRLYWFWGDTSKPAYPLGHFAMSGAVSDLPGRGALDPAVGVNLRYFVDENGFSKRMCPLPEPGMVWLDGFLTIDDKQGTQRLIAKHARMKSLGEAYERGLVMYNDKTDCFEPLVRGGPDLLLCPDMGHPVRVDAAGTPYYYFAAPFPLAVRLRVKADWDHVIDPNAYEIYTSLADSASAVPGKSYRWVTSADLLRGTRSSRQSLIAALRKEREIAPLYDVQTGKPLTPHGGSVYWNPFRRRWIMITVQQGGDSSFLGEVWYAEADTPVGLWAYARKVVTHNKYSFYNPKHHPYFDQDAGRIIYFEGTYSHTFSGDPSAATPRYDYNQIMYRLALDDPRLCLPVPVYQIQDTNGRIEYSLREELEAQKQWSLVESVPFFAVSPDRAYEGLIPVYARKVQTGNGSAVSLQTAAPTQLSEKPFFYALPVQDDNSAARSPAIVLLYEYRSSTSGGLFYSIDSAIEKDNWTRSPAPVCRVWKNPTSVFTLDPQAKPAHVLIPQDAAAK